MKNIESRYRIITEIMFDGKEEFIPQEKVLFGWRCFYRNNSRIKFSHKDTEYNDNYYTINDKFDEPNYDPFAKATEFVNDHMKNLKPRIYMRSKGRWFEK